MTIDIEELYEICKQEQQKDIKRERNINGIGIGSILLILLVWIASGTFVLNTSTIIFLLIILFNVLVLSGCFKKKRELL